MKKVANFTSNAISIFREQRFQMRRMGICRKIDRLLTNAMLYRLS